MGLRCLQINLRHCASAAASLSQLILDLNLDIVFIQEPYVSSVSANPSCIPPGFISFHSLSTDHAYGAVILCRSSFCVRLVSELSSNEVVCVEISAGNRKIQLLSCYCRPSLPNLRSLLDPILCHPCFCGNNSVLALDANAHSPVWNSSFYDVKGRELEDLIYFHKLNLANLPMADLPWIPPSTSFVDVTLVGDQLRSFISEWRFLDFPSLSDHPFIFFSIDLPHPARRPPRLPTLSEVDTTALNHNINCFLLPPASLNSCPEVDLAIDHFSSSISQALLMSRYTHITSRPRTYWWSHSLCALRSKLRAAIKELGRCPILSNLQSVKTLKRIYQREIRLSKNAAWARFFSEEFNKNPFKAINKLKSVNKKLCDIPSIRLRDGSITSDPTNILSTLASAFIPSPPPISVSDPLDLLPQIPLLSFPSITLEELQSSLFGMTRNSAPGHDGLTVDILQFLFTRIKDHLLCLYNCCLSLSYFPVTWKRAKIVVIRKPGKSDYLDSASFRPISLLPVLGKLFEKIIFGRLKYYSRIQCWFSDSQHGFVEGKSTITALTSFVGAIHSGFSQRASTGCVLLDIKGAFDHAPHSAILAALRLKGCPPELVAMVQSFLTNRSACFYHSSSELLVPIRMGCPQGSVLSPMLWNLVVDSVFNVFLPPGVVIYGFADDIAILTTSPSLSDITTRLQSACDSIVQWGSHHGLHFSESKCEVIFFSRKHHSYANSNHLSILINNKSIFPVPKVKYLGLIFDSRLSWKEHITFKCTQAKRRLMDLRRTLSLHWGAADPRKLLLLYRGVVEPMLLYGCSIWANALQYGWCRTMLRSVQRLSCALATRCFPTVSFYSAISLSNLLPIDLRALEIAASFAMKLTLPHTRQHASIIKHLLNTCSLLRPHIDIPIPSYLSRFPPWLPTKFSVSLSNSRLRCLTVPPSSWHIYSDGSKTHNSVSYGVVIFNSNGIVEQFSGKLPSACSVFEAESHGMLSGLRSIQHRLSPGDTVQVFSDSKSSLMALLSKRVILPVTYDIQVLASAIADSNTISFFWVPGHSGVYGNELADITARWTPLYPGADSHNISWVNAKSAIRQHLNSLWEAEWCSSVARSSITLFLGKPSDAKLFLDFPLPYYLSQLFSGHSRLNSFVHRINPMTSSLCSCGLEDETIYHFLFLCPLYLSQRAIFQNSCLKVSSQWPVPLRSFVHNSLLLKSLSVFVSSTRRLC